MCAEPHNYKEGKEPQRDIKPAGSKLFFIALKFFVFKIWSISYFSLSLSLCFLFIFTKVQWANAWDFHFYVFCTFSFFFFQIRLTEFTAQNTDSSQCGRGLVLPHNYWLLQRAGVRGLIK